MLTILGSFFNGVKFKTNEMYIRHVLLILQEDIHWINTRAALRLKRERYPNDWGGHPKDSGDVPRQVRWAPQWFVHRSFGEHLAGSGCLTNTAAWAPDCFRRMWKVLQPPETFGWRVGYSSLSVQKSTKMFVQTCNSLMKKI